MIFHIFLADNFDNSSEKSFINKTILFIQQALFKDQIVAEYSEADLKTLEAYGATTYRDLWPADDAFPERPYGALWTMSLETASDENVIFTKAQDIAKKRIPEAILADPSEFDAIWDTFQKELVDAGVDKVNAAYTQKVKDRVALWSTNE